MANNGHNSYEVQDLCKSKYSAELLYTWILLAEYSISFAVLAVHNKFNADVNISVATYGINKNKFKCNKLMNILFIST